MIRVKIRVSFWCYTDYNNLAEFLQAFMSCIWLPYKFSNKFHILTDVISCKKKLKPLEMLKEFAFVFLGRTFF